MLSKLLLTTGLFVALVQPALGTNILNQCSWNKPGGNPYHGDTAKAVDDYADIPADIKERLKSRIRSFDVDSVVPISKHGIPGPYMSGITDMHFATNTICRNVDQTSWKENRIEPALLYCEGDYCIIIPTICNNVSRVRKQPKGIPTVPSEQGDPPVPFIRPPVTEGTPLPPALDYPDRPDKHIDPPNTYDLPEPPTTITLILGLILMWIVVRK